MTCSGAHLRRGQTQDIGGTGMWLDGHSLDFATGGAGNLLESLASDRSQRGWWARTVLGKIFATLPARHVMAANGLAFQNDWVEVSA